MVDGNFPSFWANQYLIIRRFTYLLLRLFRVELLVQSPYWLSYYNSIFPHILSHLVPATVTPEFLAKPLPAVKDVDILYCGWIMKEKGIDDLLISLTHVLIHLPHIKVVLVGPPLPSKYFWTKRINDLSLHRNVQILDPLFNKESIVAIMRRSHALVLPTHFEGFPVSLIEAMSQGLPIISTRISSIPDIVQDHVNGLLVSPSNPKELADSIVYLLSSRSLLHHMSHNSLQIFSKKFHPTNFTSTLTNIFFS